MATLRIIDIDVEIPDDTKLTTDPPEQCRVFHTLDGASAPKLHLMLEKMAEARGYALRRTDRASYLRRGERRIEIHQISPTRLGVRIDDAEDLPLSQVFESGVGLADITVPVPGGALIEPCRERHDPSSSSWSAEWRIRHSTASEVATLMHDSLTHMGLRSGGLWPPPSGGVRRWKVEAYSAQVLVQAGITEAGDHLLLELNVIRSR